MAERQHPWMAAFAGHPPPPEPAAVYPQIPAPGPAAVYPQNPAPPGPAAQSNSSVVQGQAVAYPGGHASYGQTGAYPGGVVLHRPPSGLFPGLPARPVYREPHPVRGGPIFAGFAATVVWFALFGALAVGLNSYAWWTVVAGFGAWLVAAVLAFVGDRGVAVGIALAGSCAVSIAMAFVAAEWITTSDWPLW